MDKYEATVTGDMNPVKVAGSYFQAMEFELNYDSYTKVYNEVGDLDGEDGFIVKTLADLTRLCEIGGFVIFFHPETGLVEFMMDYEWATSEYNEGSKNE